MAIKAAPTIAFLVSALGVTGFGFLAVLVTRGHTMPFDTSLRLAIHAGAGPFATACATALSFLGRLLVLIPATAAIVIFLFRDGRRAAGLCYLAIMGGALALNWTVKAVVQRPRPLPFFGAEPATYSFPSGHVLFTSCFCGAAVLILFQGRRFAFLCAVVFVIAVAWSRVYLGVHYPTDVAAGFLLGVGWLGLVAGLGFLEGRRPSD